MSNNDYEYENAACIYSASEHEPVINPCDMPADYDIKEAVDMLYQRRNELLRENKQLRFELKICRVALILGAIHGFVSLFN